MVVPEVVETSRLYLETHLLYDAYYVIHWDLLKGPFSLVSGRLLSAVI